MHRITCIFASNWLLHSANILNYTVSRTAFNVF
nr:MAG TPA: hypothetical protein [Caudoviricetes sp.]